MTKLSILWNEFRGGSKEAFATLFSLYSDILYKYGLKFGIESDLVEDAIQDIFIHLYHNNKLPEVENPKFYLLRVLKNNILNKLAEEKKIPTTSLQDLPFTIEYDFSQLENITDEHERIELEEKVKLIIELLPPRQKEALYLRFQLEMSYEEVAKILDVSDQSTRNLIHRAIKNVRSQLSGAICLFNII